MKNLLFIILCCVMSQARAQVRTGGDAEFLMVINNENPADKPQGSPYFLGDDFRMGTIKIEQREPLEALLRYNVAQEVIEVKLKATDSEILKLEVKNEVEYDFNDRKFLWNNLEVNGKNLVGFFVKYFDGDSIKLLGKPVAEITEAVKARTGYGSDKPARIEIEEIYLLVFEDGRVEEVSLKEKEIKKALDSDKVNGFLKDNKIKTTSDLVDLLAYYEGALN